MTIDRKNTGRHAEDLAVSYLKRDGYKILAKNYRTKLGEIDIIGEDKGRIVFIEVRSRNSDRFGLPEDSIDIRKQRQIARSALLYIKRYSLEDRSSRFDIVSVDGTNESVPKITLIKDAFELDSRYRY